MKVSWLGHASFIIESGGKKLISDPFDEKLGYPVYEEEVDIATVSHEHWDHNATSILKGNPVVVKGTGEFKINGFTIIGFPTYHDKSRGKNRGSNTVYKICAEGINLLHMGDLGHILSPEQYLGLGQVDLLLLPVGGVYTIDADEAYQIVQAINPAIVIPMHFNTPHLSFELASLEQFASKFDQVVKQPFLEITANSLPEQAEIIVLDYTSQLTR